MRKGHFDNGLDNDNCRPTGNSILRYIQHVRATKPIHEVICTRRYRLGL